MRLPMSCVPMTTDGRPCSWIRAGIVEATETCAGELWRTPTRRQTCDPRSQHTAWGTADPGDRAKDVHRFILMRVRMFKVRSHGWATRRSRST